MKMVMVKMLSPMPVPTGARGFSSNLDAVVLPRRTYQGSRKRNEKRPGLSRHP